MIGWMKRSDRHLVRGKRLPAARKTAARLALEGLEDRITPATSLAPPAILDPTAAVRVDQNSYTIRGTLQTAAKNGTTISAYRDSNQNGVYNPGVDVLAASAAVAMKKTSFAVSVPLAQDANNQFFLILSDGKLKSAAVKAPLITEDSTAPTVTGITRLSNPLTSATSVSFRSPSASRSLASMPPTSMPSGPARSPPAAFRFPGPGLSTRSPSTGSAAPERSAWP